MQNSFVALKRVFLMPGSVVISSGDILVFDASNNNSLTIYRDQKIVKTLTHSLVGLQGLEKSGIIKAVETPAAPVAADGPIDPVPPIKGNTAAGPIDPVPPIKGNGNATAGPIDPVPPIGGGTSSTDSTETLTLVQKIEEELVIAELKTEVAVEDAVTAVKDTAEKIGSALSGLFHEAVGKVEGLVSETETVAQSEEQKLVEKAETEAVKVENEAKTAVADETAKVEADAKSAVSAEVDKVEAAIATEVEKVAADVAGQIEKDINTAVTDALPGAAATANTKTSTKTKK